MVDVAAAAGVSSQTVSRVVNGSGAVTPETRARVEAAMRQLSYQPNRAARALATGRFGTIGIATFSLLPFGNAQIVNAVTRTAQQAGYSVSLALVPEPTQAALDRAVEGLTDRAVDGVVVVEAKTLDAADLGIHSSLPVVVADNSAGHNRPTFGVDQDAGVQRVIDHLLGLGHRTVHHVAGPEASLDGARRLSAWRRCLRQAGAPLPEHVVGDWSARSGYEQARQLLERDDVSAIFVANDQMAVGVLRAAAERGRAVPSDLSIVGFDDIDEAAWLVPALTTIRQDLDSVGRRCAQTLLRMISGGSAAIERAAEIREIVVPEMIVRESTAAPRKKSTGGRRASGLSRRG